MKKVMDNSPDDQEEDDHSAAKMQVLHELRDMAMHMMHDRVGDKMPNEMHGVEVMAPDQESLKHGLDLAQKVLPDESGHGQPDRSHAMSPDASLGLDHMENPGDDHDDMSDDEMDQMIAELQAKKASRNPRFQS